MFSGINFKRGIVTGIAGIIFSLLVLFAFSLVVFFCQISERTVEIFIIISALIGLVFGAILNSCKSDNRGWLNGAVTGLIYMLIVESISFLITGRFRLLKILITLAVGFVAGGTGGVVGINLKSKRRKHR